MENCTPPMADPDQRRVELLAELAPPRPLPAWHPQHPPPALRQPPLPLQSRPAPTARPLHIWTRKVAGRTIAQLLTSEQADRYQAWIENDRRLRAIVTELEALAVATAHNPKAGHPNQPPPASRR